MTWMARADDAAHNPERYLTPVSVAQYAALPQVERLLRGYAAATVRRRFRASRAYVVWMGDHANDPCVDCGGQPITCDHVVPIVRGGGADTSNLAPRCASCNSRKGAR